MLGIVAEVADQDDFVDAARGHNVLRLIVYSPPSTRIKGASQVGVISLKLYQR